MPFCEFRHDAHVLLSVMRGNIPRKPSAEVVPDNIWCYLTSCWCRNPEERPPVIQIAEFLRSLYQERYGCITFDYIGEKAISPAFVEIQDIGMDRSHQNLAELPSSGNSSPRRTNPSQRDGFGIYIWVCISNSSTNLFHKD